MRFNWGLCIFLFILGIVPGVIYVIVYLVVGPDSNVGMQQQQQQQQVVVVNVPQVAAGASANKYCPSCGAQGPLTAKHCANCGAVL